MKKAHLRLRFGPRFLSLDKSLNYARLSLWERSGGYVQTISTNQLLANFKTKNMSLKYFFSFWVLPQPLFDLPIFIFFGTSDRVIQTLIPFWESAMAAHLKGFDLFRDCILHQSILTSLVVEILVLSP